MESLKRLRFFPGKLLTTEDLAAEQEYHLAKQRARNLGQFGPGVVAGLHVSTEAAGIRLSPGLAIDRRGRDVIVQESIVGPFPPALLRAWLTISYKETPTDPIPAPTWGEVEYTRIEEGFHLAWAPLGAPDPDAIVLAEVEKTPAGWRVNPTAHRIWMVAAGFGLLALLTLASRRR
ncbi:MAG TPA: hypothetical protein VGO11_15010 [Chthoniobacteraceae bacterium]|jgi:hypothetical protein|nr:hypothetical protein [Chthoniobacteraceae bacterium]